MSSRRLSAFALLLLLSLPLGAARAAPVLLVLGDSLSAAYGLRPADGWVALLQQRLVEQGYPHRVVNASITGETSAGGAARLPKLLERHRPALVLIELGANDGLRGLSVTALQANLQRMVRLSRDAGAQPLLFAMRIPPNYGPQYSKAFEDSFTALAARERIPLVPFFLGAFALDADYFQDDATHPNRRAQPLMLDAVWPALERVLKSPASG